MNSRSRTRESKSSSKYVHSKYKIHINWAFYVPFFLARKLFNLKEGMHYAIEKLRNLKILCKLNDNSNVFHFRKREKKLCPVCKTLQMRLPSHSRDDHGWSHSSSVSAVGQFNLQKRKGKSKFDKKGMKKHEHKLQIWPIDGCFRPSKNMGEHLRCELHSINPKSEKYKRLLAEAKEFEPSQIVNSPRKMCGLANKKKCKSSSTGTWNYFIISM